MRSLATRQFSKLPNHHSSIINPYIFLCVLLILSGQRQFRRN